MKAYHHVVLLLVASCATIEALSITKVESLTIIPKDIKTWPQALQTTVDTMKEASKYCFDSFPGMARKELTILCRNIN